MDDLENSSFLKFGYSTWFAYGNISKNDAIAVVQNIEAKLLIQAADEIFTYEGIVIPPGQIRVDIDVKD